MPFQDNNTNSNYNNNNNNGDRKKVNFRVGKVYGEGWYIDVSIWKTDGGIMTILTIYSVIGKDPDTGRDSFERKAPNELPRIYLNRDNIALLYNGINNIDPATLNETMTFKGNNKFTLNGTSSNVTLTISTDKGQRQVTLKALPFSTRNVHSSWASFIKII